MDVEVWSVFPAEVINLASPLDLIQTAINALENDRSWLNGNSFCTVFSQAARVGMPVASWLPIFHSAIEQLMLPNMIIAAEGGGVEVAGALDAVSSLMLQSVTPLATPYRPFMALFPLPLPHTNVSYSATWQGRLRCVSQLQCSNTTA
eukprot:COSAG02_NODE_316_length_24889_cov_9.418556_8_plen_148_part_00